MGCSAYSRAPVIVEKLFVTADTGISLLLMLDCLTTIEVKIIQKIIMHIHNSCSIRQKYYLKGEQVKKNL
jgi:hypothetical protein